MTIKKTIELLKQKKENDNLLQQTLDENSIVLMTTKDCVYCKDAKKFLKQKKQEYKEIVYTPLMNDMFFKKYKKKYPYVPRVMIDQKFIGGFKELKEYFTTTKSKKDPLK